MAFSFGGGTSGVAGGGTSFSFGGAPASAPATTAATGFPFGSNPPASAAKPVASLSTGLSFGSTGTTTGFGGAAAPAFGAAAGTAAAAAPTSLFGAAASSTAAPAFGATAAATAAPSLFGAPSAPGGTTSLFGTASTAASGFGTSATSTTTAFGLTAAPKPTGLATPFGASTAAAPSFGLGAPTAAAPSFGLGSAASTAAAPALGFGTTTATTAPTLGLGGAPAVGLGGQSSLGATAPFGVPSSSFQALSSAGITQVGGVAVTGSVSGANKKDDSWKDSPVPPEFNQDVDAFRKYVKDQKGVSTDMSHLSLPKLHQKIKSDVEGLSAVVQQLGSGVAKQKAQLERLKKDCAKELVNVEVAQRTKDTPPALQYENNNGPIEYFNRLLANFESQMIVYKRQIEDVENYLQTAAAGSAGGPQSASASETLIKALQKTHSAFVSLAGRYQPLHEAIQQQKSIYVQQFRQKHGTTDNPFSDRPGLVKGVGRADSLTSNRVLGPSPFTGKPDPVSMARAAALAHQSTTTNQTGTAGPPTFGAMSSGNPASGGGFGFSGGAVGGLGQSNMSPFVASTPKPAFGVALTGTSGAGGLFNNSAQQPGILGSSMLQTPPTAASSTTFGLFGQQTPQNQLTFGGKRGKPAF